MSKNKNLEKDFFEDIFANLPEETFIDERDFIIESLEEEVQELRRRDARRVLEDDLQKIRAIDPEIERIDDLGSTFISLRASGVGTEDAYRALLAINSKKEIPQMGDVLTGNENKDYFTPEEVKAMTKSEVKKNYDKIRKSMSHWK